MTEDFIEGMKGRKLSVATDDVLSKLDPKSFPKVIDQILDLANPILQFAVKACEMAIDYTSFFRLKCWLKIFNEIETVSEVERNRFIDKLNEDPRFKERFTMTVIAIVERVSDLEKVEIISRLIVARQKEKITNTTFLRLMHVVDSMQWDNLYLFSLKHMFHHVKINLENRQELRNIEKSIDFDSANQMFSSYGLLSFNQKLEWYRNEEKYGGGEKNRA